MASSRFRKAEPNSSFHFQIPYVASPLSPGQSAKVRTKILRPPKPVRFAGLRGVTVCVLCGMQEAEYSCTRVPPTVGGLSVFGGLDPVAASELEPVMALLDEEEPDTAELVEFLSRRFAPKTDSPATL